MSRKISTFPTHLLSSTPAFPLHTFFECPAGSENGSWLSLDHAWVWIIMFLSQVTSKTKESLVKTLLTFCSEKSDFLNDGVPKISIKTPGPGSVLNNENANDNQSETQVWITSQIWFPKSRRLAATDQIFG